MPAYPESSRRAPVDRCGEYARPYRADRNVCPIPRTTSVRSVLCLGWAVAAALLGGCGDRGPERAILSGTVTYKGKPVAEGTILFTPVAKSQVPSAGASIADGRYKADVHGGVPVGTHRIVIEAYQMVPFALRPGEAPPRNYFEGKVREQYLHKTYNANSKLEITIEPGSRAITKDFDLTD
jgi:hypothetical protein